MDLDRGDVVLALVGLMLLYRALWPSWRRYARRKFQRETEEQEEAWRSVRAVGSEDGGDPDERPR